MEDERRMLNPMPAFISAMPLMDAGHLLGVGFVLVLTAHRGSGRHSVRRRGITIASTTNLYQVHSAVSRRR